MNDNLMSEFFGGGQRNGTQRRPLTQYQLDLKQARQDVNALTEATEKLVAWFDENRPKLAKAAADQVIENVEKFFAQKGYKVNWTVKAKKAESPPDSNSPVSAIFGQKSLDVGVETKRKINQQQREACRAIFGSNFAACSQTEVGDNE